MKSIQVENTYSAGSAVNRQLGAHSARRRGLGSWMLAVAITASLATTASAGTTFQGTTFQGTTFQGTTFQGTTFQGTTFQGTTFQGTTFQGTTFQGTSHHSVRLPVSTPSRASTGASTGAARRWPWQPESCDRMHAVRTWILTGSRCRASQIAPARIQVRRQPPR